MTFEIDVEAKGTLVGQQSVFVAVYDGAGNHNNWNNYAPVTTWEPFGTPPAVELSYLGGNGNGQSGLLTFAFRNKSGNGFRTVRAMEVRVNSTASFPSSCTINIHRTRRWLSLVNDAGNAYLPKRTLGLPEGTVENSQCVVDPEKATIAEEDELVRVTLPVTFKTAFAGSKNVYLVAEDRAGRLTTNYNVPQATWTVTAGPIERAVGEWRGDGNAADSSGANNSGLVNGTVSFPSSALGSSFQMGTAGASGYVTIPPPPAPRTSAQIAGARTFTAWVMASDSSGMAAPIATFGTPGAGDLFGITGQNPGTCPTPPLRLSINHWGLACIYSSAPIQLNRWTHVAFTWDGTNFLFYVDGAAAGGGPHPLYSYPLSTLVLGGNTIGGTTTKGWFNGLMDDVKLYDSVLSASVIADLAETSPGVTLTLTPPNASVASTGTDEAFFDVESNKPGWEQSVTTPDNWITNLRVVASAGNGSGRVYYKVTSNCSGPRTGTININFGGTTTTFRLTQDAGQALEISPAIWDPVWSSTQKKFELRACGSANVITSGVTWAMAPGFGNQSGTYGSVSPVSAGGGTAVYVAPETITNPIEVRVRASYAGSYIDGVVKLVPFFALTGIQYYQNNYEGRSGNFSFNHTFGAQPFVPAYEMLVSTTSGSLDNACHVTFLPGVNNAKMVLTRDDGSGLVNSPAHYAPLTDNLDITSDRARGLEANSQCILNHGSASVDVNYASGTPFQVAWGYGIYFHPGFSGSKTMYTKISDGVSPWEARYNFAITPVATLPPTIQLNSPAAGATVSGTVTIAGWALDNNQRAETSVQKVEIFLDGNKITEILPQQFVNSTACTQYPGRPSCPNVGFSYAWNTTASIDPVQPGIGPPANGTHELMIIATDLDTPDSLKAVLRRTITISN